MGCWGWGRIPLKKNICDFDKCQIENPKGPPYSNKTHNVTNSPQNRTSPDLQNNLPSTELVKLKATKPYEEESSCVETFPTLSRMSSESRDVSSMSSDSSLTPSMVSHWIPLSSYSFQNPGSLPSMITHVVKLPSPGSILLSIEEVLEEMRIMFDRYFS